MNSYIIRIYRREKDNPHMLVGAVEEVGVEGNKGFTNLDGLWKILNATTRGATGKKRRDATSQKRKQEEA